MTRNIALLLCSVCVLTACETGKPVDAQNQSKQASQKLSMIDISRGLSGGSVDVYESEGALLTKPVPPSGKNFTASSVPVSKDIITTDKNVVIYDLDTGQPIKTQMQVQSENIDDEVEPPIPPIGLPDLQPPVEALGDLPSPFDDQGNLKPDEKMVTKIKSSKTNSKSKSSKKK